MFLERATFLHMSFISWEYVAIPTERVPWIWPGLWLRNTCSWDEKKSLCSWFLTQATWQPACCSPKTHQSSHIRQEWPPQSQVPSLRYHTWLRLKLFPTHKARLSSKHLDLLLSQNAASCAWSAICWDQAWIWEWQLCIAFIFHYLSGKTAQMYVLLHIKTQHTSYVIDTTSHTAHHIHKSNWKLSEGWGKITVSHGKMEETATLSLCMQSWQKNLSFISGMLSQCYQLCYAVWKKCKSRYSKVGWVQQFFLQFI